MTRRVTAAIIAVAAFAAIARADILITEVLYDPAGGNEHEYVELYNNGDEAVDLTGYILRDNPNQDFPNSATLTGGSIEPGGFAVLIRIDENRLRDNYEAAWGADLNYVEIPNWPVFSNGGDIVELLDSAMTVIASVPYTPGTGFPFPNDSASIYMVDTEASSPYAAANWLLSQVGIDCARRGNAPREGDVGSPGLLPDSDCDAKPPILVTEIMYDPNLNNEHEYVELYNTTDDEINLTGWVISDDPGQDFPNPYTLTEGSIKPGCTAVLIRIDHARSLANFQAAWGDDINFIEIPAWPIFSNGGDTVQLSDPQGEVIASVTYTVTTGYPFPNDASSIYMKDDTSDDLYGSENWALSQVGVDRAVQGNAPRAADIGSPGRVPFIVPGDCNLDGFLDLLDAANMVDCVSGPAVASTSGCECFDFDHDGCITLGDFASFQIRFGSYLP